MEHSTSVFLDVSQAFDGVYHPGLLHKIIKLLPSLFPLLEYLSNRQFHTRVNGEVSPLFHINSGVLQGSVLGYMLYLLFTSDLPQAPYIKIGTFADDIVILPCHNDIFRAFSYIQD